MSLLLTCLHDGSKLLKHSAKELSQLPIWNGNRILDREHVETLKATIKDPRTLDLKPFHVVTYPTDEGPVRVIIDGQHRVQILQDYFTNEADPWTDTDFQVLVIERFCHSEQEVQSLFQILNRTKSIEWSEDPVLVANRYVEALCSKFNSPKRQLIRLGKTRKPYISVDSLREHMVSRRVGFGAQEPPEVYAERLYQEHLEHLRALSVQDLETLPPEQKTALKAGCLLTCMTPDWVDTK